MKKHFPVPLLQGVAKDYPARNIPDDKLSDCLNVVFENHHILRRYGYSTLGSNLPLDGAVMLIAFYEQPRSGDKYTIAVTSRNIYKFSSTNNLWTFITKTYSTGTVTATVLAVTGSGTTWLNASWTKNTYRMLFGTTDQNLRTITRNGTLASGSNSITITTTNLYVGMPVSGTGIPAGARVRSIGSGTITISANATADGAQSLVFSISFFEVSAVSSATAIVLDAVGTFSGTTTNGSAVVTGIADTSVLHVGMGLSGTGIAAGAYILSIDSATQITMSANATADGTPTITIGVIVPAGTAYCLQLCLSGTEDDQISVCAPYFSSTGDKALVISNGVDPIQKWIGIGNCEDLANTEFTAKVIGFFGSSSYERMVAGWTMEGASLFPQKLKVADAGNPESWSGAYYEFLTTNDEIKAIRSMGPRMILYKSRSISIVYPSASGTNEDPFDLEQNAIAEIGTYSGYSIEEIHGAHYFLGSDCNVYVYNGVNIIAIGDEVSLSIKKNLNGLFAKRSFSIHFDDMYLYALFIPTVEITDYNGVLIKEASEYPDLAYVYNYKDKTWTIWSFADIMISYGYVRKEYAPTWEDLKIEGLKVYQKTIRWSDMFTFSNLIGFCFGDRDGYVYEYGSMFSDDNGTDISAFIETKDYALNDPKHAFKLLEIVMGYIRKRNPGNVRIRASVDFGEQWSEWHTVAMDGNVDYVEKIVNFVLRGKRVRFHVENVDGADFELESFILGYNDDSTKGVVK